MKLVVLASSLPILVVGAHRGLLQQRLAAAAAIATALLFPLPSAVAVALIVLSSRLRSGNDVDREVMFHRRVAAGMAAGLGMRAAMTSACEHGDRPPGPEAARMLQSGQPVSQLTDHLATMLPVTGDLAIAAVTAGERSGGRMAPIFTSMADLAVDEAEMAREVQIETAAARLALWVVGGGPVVVLVGLALSGRIGVLAATPTGRALLGLGVALIGAGVAAALWTLRRGRSR